MLHQLRVHRVEARNHRDEERRRCVGHQGHHRDEERQYVGHQGRCPGDQLNSAWVDAHQGVAELDDPLRLMVYQGVAELDDPLHSLADVGVAVQRRHRWTHRFVGAVLGEGSLDHLVKRCEQVLASVLRHDCGQPLALQLLQEFHLQLH